MRIELTKVEEVLRQETAIIDPTDVAPLLVLLYEVAGAPIPSAILEEVAENAHDRGDCDPDNCPLCERYG